MFRQLATFGFLMLSVLMSACTSRGTASAPIIPQAQGGPEVAARTAMEQYAQQVGIPYRNGSFSVLSNDGTFAAVRILVQFRQSAQAEWQEYQADIECRKVGNRWQAYGSPYFRLSDKEQFNLAATTVAREAPRIATATALAAPTATVQAAAKATEQATRLLALSGQIGQIYSVAFSPDGRTLASGSEGGTVHLWDVGTGAVLQVLTHGQEVHMVAFAPDGKTLVSGAKDKQVRQWDVSSGKELRTIDGFQKYPYGLAFSPDSQLLAIADTGIYYTEIVLWDVSNWHESYRFSPGNNFEMCWECNGGLAFSPDGSILAIAGDRYHDGVVVLLDVTSRKELRILDPVGASVNTVAFSADGRSLVVGLRRGEAAAEVWAVTGEKLGDLGGFTSGGWVKTAAFSLDGQIVATAESWRIRLYDASTYQLLRELEGGSPIAFSPIDTILASAAGDYPLRLWKVR